MRPTTAPPFSYISWIIALLIGLIVVGLAYGVRHAIEGADSNTPHSWLNLTLLLGGYLLLFCLQPIQKAVQRKLCRQAAR